MSQLTDQVELAQAAATNAQNSASNAQTSATNAASSETNASNSASAANQSATNASNSALTAAQDAQDAQDAADAADLSATAAAQSAQDAANSAASARGLQIGTVYFSQSGLATDNPGGLPLWTGEYFSNGSSLYPDFYNWVKSHTELCKTKTEYDAAISTYGESPYYVVDEVEGSLRLPKLVNYLKMANATDGVTQAQAGLPNITGTLPNCQMDSTSATGAFKSIGSDIYGGTNSGYPRGSVDFSAQRSSAVYGRSSTVTPAHTTVYPWVYAFNSAVSASEAQAAEFTEALSGKANADLSNGTKATQESINNIMPANMDYVVESGSSGSTWYRKYKSGWIEQGGYTVRDSSGGDYSKQTNVTFLKAFTQTPLQILVSPYTPSYADGINFVLKAYNASTTGFVYFWQGGDNRHYIIGSFWYACGK